MQTKFTRKQNDYLKALAYMDYRFEGATIPYILLGETARAMKDMKNLDELNGLEVGIDKRTLSKYSANILIDWLGKGWPNKVHMVEGVPVHFKLIERKYQFFKRLDQIPYWGGSFSIANPFDKYWKARFIVK